MSEDAIRKNIVLIYELLDEVRRASPANGCLGWRAPRGEEGGGQHGASCWMR